MSVDARRKGACAEGDGGEGSQGPQDPWRQLLTLQLDLSVGVVETPMVCHSAGGLQVG